MVSKSTPGRTNTNIESGEFIAKISYSSDLAGYDEGQRRTPELHRRGFIDIEIKSTVALLHETKGINSILQSCKLLAILDSFPY